jgi:nitrate reductase gamma subunit
MASFVYVTIYACALIFVAGCVIRAVRYARMPPHLRWELYPVPHEAPERAAHGGSYFEQLDWWTRPREFNLLAEMKMMLSEIFFFKGIWEHNRKLWFRSFPFHFGLYLIAASATLLTLTAILSLAIPAAVSGVLGHGLHYAYTVAGAAGALLASVGAVGLLLRRLTEPDVKPYTTAGDVFNLFAFLAVLGLLVAGCLYRPGALSLSDVARGILTFDPSVEITGLLAAGLITASLLVAYIPMTQMAHFVAKYFAYHSVRWNDEPNHGSGTMQKKIAECLAYRPSWSAPHVGADGTKTWVDVALTNPAQQVKK